ncbi:hypothetical protein FB45DRAFT_1035073 [Roridomyces roridus]|uniref:DUF8205 domain-containing protein n=1 Tax=Roridomyces roridus TaxID=1738132 RepID=A0AAD7BB40_9AGAR|nr:hypothetical protein FB45DRAFT_1035073 [Roridomyces roridus]
MSKGNRLSNLVPFAIERIIIDRVVGMGMKMESHDPVTGKVTMVPLTIDNILRFTNNHIRLDRDNNLGLRTTMTETELQVIRNATRQDVAAEEGERGDFASLLLKRKLLTVPEYKKYFASPS